MAQLPQTFPRKKWKTSFLNEDQKVELIIRLFPINLFFLLMYIYFFYFLRNSFLISSLLHSSKNNRFTCNRKCQPLGSANNLDCLEAYFCISFSFFYSFWFLLFFVFLFISFFLLFSIFFIHFFFYYYLFLLASLW